VGFGISATGQALMMTRLAYGRELHYKNSDRAKQKDVDHTALVKDDVQ
jgi:hypothetical protein